MTLARLRRLWGRREWARIQLGDPVPDVSALEVVGDPGDPRVAEVVALAAGRGIEITLVSATLPDARVSFSLVQSGLPRLRLPVSGPTDELAFRCAEKLVAMRDANRKTGPKVELGLRVGTDVAPLLALIAVCETRFTDIEPWVEEHATPLDEAKKRAKRAGFGRTVESIGRG